MIYIILLKVRVHLVSSHTGLTSAPGMRKFTGQVIYLLRRFVQSAADKTSCIAQKYIDQALASLNVFRPRANEP